MTSPMKLLSNRPLYHLVGYKSTLDKSMEYSQKDNVAKADSLLLELLQEVLEGCGQVGMLLNENAEIIFCTDNIQAIAGYDPEDLIGSTAFNFFLPEGVPSARRHHAKIVACKRGYASAFLAVRHKNGLFIWIDASVKKLRHPDFTNNLFVSLKRSDLMNEEGGKLAQAIADAREDEREYLATELHDNVNQIIAVSKLLVDTARNSNNQEDLLRQTSGQLQLATEQIRKLSYSRTSYALQEFGLLIAVRSLIETVSRINTINFTIDVDAHADWLLTSEQSFHVYRIIQEAITNTLKHAEASEMLIRMERKKYVAYLILNDNGKGFIMGTQKPRVGLASITNRVKLLQGQLHIVASQNTGTTIEIHFPL
jgi:PAS domain S-box-containing protein